MLFMCKPALHIHTCITHAITSTETHPPSTHCGPTGLWMRSKFTSGGGLLRWYALAYKPLLAVRLASKLGSAEGQGRALKAPITAAPAAESQSEGGVKSHPPPTSSFYFSSWLFVLQLLAAIQNNIYYILSVLKGIFQHFREITDLLLRVEFQWEVKLILTLGE